MLNEQALRENFEKIRKEISEAALNAGRKPEEIELIAVSKTVGIDAIVAAHNVCGQSLFGENRADALRDKSAEIAERGLGEAIHFDFIGNLQRNKLRWVVGTARIIHSVDSLKILQAIARHAEEKGIVQSLLLQVDVAKEEAKSGFDESELDEAVAFALGALHLDLKGFMCMAPNLPAGEIAWVFESLKKTRDHYLRKYQNKLGDSLQLSKLSMGMSNDFPVAIASGADFVRIGSSLFHGIS